MSDSQPFISRSLQRNPWAPRTLFSSSMSVISTLCAVIAVIPLFSVLYMVISKGFSRFNLDLFTQIQPAALSDGGGLLNALQGTFYTVSIATLLAVPIGVLAAVFLAEFVRDTKLARWIGFATNVLSGVPSIVAGTFVYSLLVLTTKQFSAFAGGVALAVLMLPVIVRTATEALELVPQELRQAAVGLGASRFQTVSRVVLPAALPGIITGAMLGVARAAGETAPVLFTALGSQYLSNSIWEPAATLSLRVYNFATSPYKNLQDLAWAGALLLVLMVLVANILSRLLVQRRA
ncbi:phosphate ABC transporter permease PstA [filamentous cyanobacterium LEGE 11480]|uniref:Phosphate transport system permease protein PstA n=1 Tax=Romeriopsis navalis LEGE 11480 TaxID=2777977 RepID=A0A928VN16_9CYAN|nr:phosphate ABC transporter permease PstA [Romeriopsis navalis]MBE9030627.1 phosphate ABC transporter permease PstA [Romeriopsis navalis LEGE 11480]